MVTSQRRENTIIKFHFVYLFFLLLKKKIQRSDLFSGLVFLVAS